MTSDLRSLDRLVAEKVMGWTPPTRPYQPWDMDPVNHPGCVLVGNDSLPHFSESIADAWLVVERMREKGWWVDLRLGPDANGNTGLGTAWFEKDGNRVAWDAYHQDIAVAICRAALQAVGETE